MEIWTCLYLKVHQNTFKGWDIRDKNIGKMWAYGASLFIVVSSIMYYERWVFDGLELPDTLYHFAFYHVFFCPTKEMPFRSIFSCRDK